MSGHMEFARTTNILLVEQGFSTCCRVGQLAIRRVQRQDRTDRQVLALLQSGYVAPSTAQAWFLWTQKQEWNPNQLGILIKIKSGDEISLTSLRPPNALAFSKEKKLAQRGRQLQCKCKGPRGPWSGKNSISLITNGSQALGIPSAGLLLSIRDTS